MLADLCDSLCFSFTHPGEMELREREKKAADHLGLSDPVPSW
jgi:hypothetical protein